MNIDQRIRSIIWPVAFFLFINTLAIVLFVAYGFADVEGSTATTVFRAFSLVVSIAVSLKAYLYLKTTMLKEHEVHTLRMHIAHGITMSKGILIILQDLAIGLIQSFFILVSGLTFWIIVNFTEEPVSILNQVVFYLGYGTVILAAAYVLVHRIGLAVLSIRK